MPVDTPASAHAARRAAADAAANPIVCIVQRRVAGLGVGAVSHPHSVTRARPQRRPMPPFSIPVHARGAFCRAPPPPCGTRSPRRRRLCSLTPGAVARPLQMSFVVTPTLAVAGLTAAYGALTVASPAGLYKTMYTKKEQSKAGRTAARWGGLFLITGGALGIAANHMARVGGDGGRRRLHLWLRAVRGTGGTDRARCPRRQRTRTRRSC